MAHAHWPDVGFDYFLAQRRAPDEAFYYPSLLFGLDPIDPKKASPPPAPSGVYPGRGLAVLRAEESPRYWESPAPAVGMRLATPYAHHVQDCFSLTGFYAFNRPIYVNRKHATNYSGVDPGFSNSSRSHTAVVVDFEEPKTVDEVDLRRDFSEHFKFVSARGQGIYDGVEQARSLVLTRDYMLDVFQLRSDRPRHYQWIVQGLGHAYPGQTQRWTPSRDLVGYLFNLGDERSLHTGDDWSVTLLQSSGGAHRQFSGLGEKWFDRRIGSRITMFGERGTAAYVARSPVVTDTSGRWHGKDRFCYGEDEPAVIDLSDFAPGRQRDIAVIVSGDSTAANRLGQLQLVGDGTESSAEQGRRYNTGQFPGVLVASTVLPVAQGVCRKRGQRWPADFAYTIYSPRYIAKAYYMDSGATSLLLDPLGYRRSDSSGASYPQIVRFATDDRGREDWRSENVPKFPYFVPVVVPGLGEKPAYVYEAGWHAHGSRSAMEHRFTEDWIVVRFLEAQPQERIALSWHPQSRKNGLQSTILGRDPILAEQKMPGRVLVATPDGKIHDAGAPGDWPRRADLPKEIVRITAVFHRPHGYQYGSALLYPNNSQREGSYITQPGDKPMAFTFCLEAEFAEIVRKWQKEPPAAEASEQERRIYGGAFMPYLETP